jgi:hypothetical protein
MRWISGAVIAGGCVACQALSGVDDLTFIEGSDASAGGGMGGSHAGNGGGSGAVPGGGGASGSAGLVSSTGGDAGTGTAGASTGGTSGSGGGTSNGGGAGGCSPMTCDGNWCGSVLDPCTGVGVECKCTGPRTCNSGTCKEVVALYCAGQLCGGAFEEEKLFVESAACGGGTCTGAPARLCVSAVLGDPVEVMPSGGCLPGHHDAGPSFKFTNCGTSASFIICVPD